MKKQYFKVRNREQTAVQPNFDYHNIDKGGNHFINGKCVNPKKGEGKIGERHPPLKDRV